MLFFFVELNDVYFYMVISTCFLFGRQHFYFVFRMKTGVTLNFYKLHDMFQTGLNIRRLSNTFIE